MRHSLLALAVTCAAWLFVCQPSIADQPAVADQPASVSQAAERMTAPPGFTVDLFAGEPDVVQPIAMTFDARGRLWVVECLSYPQWSPDNTGHDRVTIFEDTNHDGQHDKRTVFLENGVNLSGIELGFGGVWLTATPNLIFVPDRDGDDRPDGPPEVILDGWDVTAKHNVFNSLIWGPDGWLYGCNGILSRSRVGPPGTPDDQRTPLDCGVWRYHPTQREFNVVASGSTNPWGLDFDDYGQAFITNCVIKHLFHIIPGAHYDRMFGQDVNPYAYRLLPSCADHIHWGGGHWTTARGGAAHDDAGGGHAHSGGAIYLADQFPAEYRNSIFMCNIHGNRLNRDALHAEGASYVGSHADDFVHAHDPWFRGICLKTSPDGSLFVTDWTDTGECHNYEVVDASNGRIYRISYGEKQSTDIDLQKLSLAELVALQFDRNDWLVRTARRILQERCRAVVSDPSQQAAASQAIALLSQYQPTDEQQAVRQVWALYAVGGLEAVRAAGLDSIDAPLWVRFWMIQLAADEPAPWSPSLRQQIAQQLSQPTPLIIFSLASTCQRRIRLGHTDDVRELLVQLLQRGETVVEKSHANQPTDEHRDQHADHDNDDDAELLATLKWYAVEPLVASESDWVLQLLPSMVAPEVQHSIARRLVTIDGGLERLTGVWREHPQAAWLADSIAGVLTATDGIVRQDPPSGWSETYVALQQNPNQDVRQRARQLGSLFGDEHAIEAYRSLLTDSSQRPDDRQGALELLLARQVPGLEPDVLRLLDDEHLRIPAIRALATVGGDEVPAHLLALYAHASLEEKQEIVYALTTRLPLARALVAAMEAGDIPRSDVSALVVRQLHALQDVALTARLKNAWGEVRPVSENKLQLIEQYRSELSPDALAAADLTAGRVVYQKTCGACHKLFGEGGTIGPELTGGQRRNLDYLLDNMIDPSAIVPGDYRMAMLMLDDGRILNGIIREETPQRIQLQTATELVSVTHDRIEERRGSDVSMMPEGILDALQPMERRDLIAYLQANGPAVTDGDQAASEKGTSPPADPWHLLHPVWLKPPTGDAAKDPTADTIYSESITLLQHTVDGPLVGRTAYPIASIESVVSANRTADWTQVEGLKVNLQTGTIEIPVASGAPYISVDQLYPPVDSPNSYRHRVGHPEQALLYGPGRWFHDHQIEVTYRVDRQLARLENADAAQAALQQLPRTLALLRAGQPLVIGCSGDSIAAGGDASQLAGAEPMQPPFPTLVAQQLREVYPGSIELKNRAVGGWSIQNGLDDLDAMLAEKPDLIIVAYGMNDVGRRDPQWFADRNRDFVQRVRAADANIELLFVSSMLGNKVWIHTPREMFSLYRDQLAQLTGPGIALADVSAVWQQQLQNKGDLDLTGNGLNHPNDYGHRLYAQTILGLLVE